MSQKLLCNEKILQKNADCFGTKPEQQSTKKNYLNFFPYSYHLTAEKDLKSIPSHAEGNHHQQLWEYNHLLSTSSPHISNQLTKTFISTIDHFDLDTVVCLDSILNKPSHKITVFQTNRDGQKCFSLQHCLTAIAKLPHSKLHHSNIFNAFVKCSCKTSFSPQ